MSSISTASPAIVFEWNGGETLSGDSMTGVVQQILGDTYQPDNLEASLIDRWETLVDLATRMQAIVMTGDDVDFERCTEDQLNLALASKRDQLAVDDWDGDFPLILVATVYQPYTSTPRPAGNVIVIDPHTEKSFLEAFTQLGLAILAVR